MERWLAGRCSERFCCVSFRLAKRPPWRPVGSGNSTCHPTLEACPKTGTLSCHGQSCPRFQLRVLWALILEQGFLPYQLAHNAIKRLLRRSFHRARFHVESVANCNAYLLKQAIGALNCMIYTTPLSRLVKHRRAKARHAVNHAAHTARDWRCVMARLDKM